MISLRTDFSTFSDPSYCNVGAICEGELVPVSYKLPETFDRDYFLDRSTHEEKLQEAFNILAVISYSRKGGWTARNKAYVREHWALPNRNSLPYGPRSLECLFNIAPMNDVLDDRIVSQMNGLDFGDFRLSGTDIIAYLESGHALLTHEEFAGAGLEQEYIDYISRNFTSMEKS